MHRARLLHLVASPQPLQHLHGPLPGPDEAGHRRQRDGHLRRASPLRSLQRAHQPHPVRLPQREL